MSSAVRITLSCDIVAPPAAVDSLAAIVRTCALDLHQPVVVGARRIKDAAITITVVLSAGHFLEPHEAWRLACRLACFCPQARVSVLVQSLASVAESGLERARACAA